MAKKGIKKGFTMVDPRSPKGAAAGIRTDMVGEQRLRRELGMKPSTDYTSRVKAAFPTKKTNILGFKKGGKVKKTGLAKLHKGERVLTKKQTKKFDQKKFNAARKSHFKY